MGGFWVLLALVFLSALPVIGIGLWFRFGRIPVGAPLFFCSLLGGILSLPLAGLLQSFFPPIPEAGLSAFLLPLFFRNALAEEASRILPLALLFYPLRRLWRRSPEAPAGEGTPAAGTPDPSRPRVPEPLAAAAGLAAGLGFSIVETVSYGSSALGIALLRAFTAAPIHGACGSRVACAVALFPEHPGAALFRFAGAVLIHGIFNFAAFRPGGSFAIPAVLVAAALLPVLRLVGTARRPPPEASPP